MKKLVIISIAILTVFCAFFLTMPTQAMGEKGEGVQLSARQKAPDFMLTDLDGRIVKLSDFKGKVIILDFWATWCPPCQAEVPDFVALQEKYGAKGFQMLGISLDQGGTSVVRPFAVEKGINYPVLLADGKVESAYGGIRGIPTTFVIDREGNIRTKYIGFTAKERFENDVISLLEEK